VTNYSLSLPLQDYTATICQMTMLLGCGVQSFRTVYCGAHTAQHGVVDDNLAQLQRSKNEPQNDRKEACKGAKRPFNTG
jgi:hypothetical protein